MGFDDGLIHMLWHFDARRDHREFHARDRERRLGALRAIRRKERHARGDGCNWHD
jgi:hypothetical protein